MTMSDSVISPIHEFPILSFVIVPYCRSYPIPIISSQAHRPRCSILALCRAIPYHLISPLSIRFVLSCFLCFFSSCLHYPLPHPISLPPPICYPFSAKAKYYFTAVSHPSKFPIHTPPRCHLVLHL